MSTPRVALVTGVGQRRIGWSVAEALAQRKYSLAVHYRSKAAEADALVAQLKASGLEAMAVQAELSDDQAVRNMIETVVAKFGRIDVLVHCAATWHRKKLEEITADDVLLDLRSNTLATFLCCQLAGLQMTRQPEGGCIVTFGDWATSRPYVNYAGYFASKGSIRTLTRTMAVELGTRNPRVRVNCILPGPVLIPVEVPEAERQRVIRATIAGRVGKPENIAQAVLHFIDNDFVTGTCLPVDGGRSIYSSDSGA